MTNTHAYLSTPLISIVTPSFNQGEYIEETICSVLDQGYPNLEYIIIDGGSTDNSVEMIRRYEKYLTYWVSEKDNGQTHAINKGLRRVTGDVIGYLNSDDLLTPGSLNVIADFSNERIGTSGIFSFAGASFGDCEQERIFLPGGNPSLAEWINGNSSLFQPATFWTKELQEEVGIFNEDFRFAFDKEFFVRAVHLFGRYQRGTNDVVARFRVHDQSKTATILVHRDRENALIREYVLSNTVLLSRLRKEEKRQVYEALMDGLSIGESRLSTIQLLLKAAVADPRSACSRFYLGAWRKLLQPRRGGA